MSHFVTLVLVPENTHDDIEQVVGKLLAPFDENKEVPTYDRECYCVGSAANKYGREVATAQTGGFDKLRETFKDAHPLPVGVKCVWDLDEDAQEAHDKAWRQHISAHLAMEREAAEAHPFAGKPDPSCNDCNGKGTSPSEYNPQSKWDWWSIGGRWTGMLSGYDPNKSDVLPVSTLLHAGPIDKKKIPYALVTPDGQWHQKGDMGWFGCSTNEKDKDEWHACVNALLEQNKDCLAVVCDLHI